MIILVEIIIDLLVMARILVVAVAAAAAVSAAAAAVAAAVVVVVVVAAVVVAINRALFLAPEAVTEIAAKLHPATTSSCVHLMLSSLSMGTSAMKSAINMFLRIDSRVFCAFALLSLVRLYGM
jgi:hypothetical protein